MACRVLCVMFLISFGSCNSQLGREGFMDHLSNGMKFAKDFLGSESIALKVAEFVVRAYQNANRPAPIRRNPNYNVDDTTNEGSYEKQPNSNLNEDYSPISPLKHLVKLFGLKSNQISAVAVNAIVFVVQMISSFLAGPRRPGRSYHDDPSSWILNKKSKSLQDLLETAKSDTLPERIEDLIKEQGTDEETSCIRLLVCKITPFVNRMQRAVFGNETFDSSGEVRGSAGLYRHLPSREEISERSDVCEQKHKDCDLNE